MSEPARVPRKSFSSTAARLLSLDRASVGEVTSPALREHTRRVRHEVYCLEKKFLTPADLFDAYDDRALILNAYKGDLPIGTLRITDSADGPLEIFEMHPELLPLVPARARLLEVSRLMVVKRHRGFHATMPLFRRVFHETMARRADGLILSCAKGLIPYYRDLIGFRQLSEEPLHHRRLRGLCDYPMILDLPDCLAYATPARLSVWFGIDPVWTLRALGLTAARKLRETSLPPPEKNAA
jgi:hypothetical protein